MNLRPKWTLPFFALIALSCSGNNGVTTANGLSSQQCRWPSVLTDGGGRTTCQAARALVSCTDSTGAGCGCISNDVSCDGCQVSGVTCHDQCAANQYAVACGGVGPGPVPSPPDGCTFASANPGGIAYYCCPCN